MKNNYIISIFSDLLRIRKVELMISREYKNGEMRCPVHLSIGQEATPVGICRNLTKKDQIVSTHRSHAHYLAKGGNLKKMMAEIYGKISGCSKGKGGSMHLIDLNVGMVAAVPIVGSTIPIGTGLAWANKLEKNNKIVIVFLGDGATEEGVFFESLDFASLHNLKVIFVCENNFYSVYSPLRYRQSKKRKLLSIVKSFGIKSYKIDGNDTLKIYSMSKKIIKDVKSGKGPAFIFLDTYRWLEHCGPNNDDSLDYRPDYEIKKWVKKCPIKKLQLKLFSKKILDHDKLKKINYKIDEEILSAFNFAKKSKFPKLKELNKDVYAD